MYTRTLRTVSLAYIPITLLKDYDMRTITYSRLYHPAEANL